MRGSTEFTPASPGQVGVASALDQIGHGTPNTHMRWFDCAAKMQAPNDLGILENE
jgi:hypothetical protein